jgi:hypothetical protein
MQGLACLQEIGNRIDGLFPEAHFCIGCFHRIGHPCARATDPVWR